MVGGRHDFNSEVFSAAHTGMPWIILAAIAVSMPSAIPIVAAGGYSATDAPRLEGPGAELGTVAFASAHAAPPAVAIPTTGIMDRGV